MRSCEGGQAVNLRRGLAEAFGALRDRRAVLARFQHALSHAKGFLAPRIPVASSALPQFKQGSKEHLSAFRKRFRRTGGCGALREIAKAIDEVAEVGLGGARGHGVD